MNIESGKDNISKNLISYIKFSNEENKLPEFSEKKVKNKKWIPFGTDNLYPDFLLKLYETSAYHNAIVSGKAFYINGKGWDIRKDGLSTEQIALLNKFVEDSNPYENLTDITEQISLDLELLGGFALEIIWNNITGKIAEIHYIDIFKLRKNEDGSLIFYSEDWSKYNQSEKETGFRELLPFDENVRKGNAIYYYVEPRKGAKNYPKPSYIGGIKSIVSDSEISNYHLNSIKNGFVGGTLINFANGTPTKEEQEAIEKKIKAKHTGTDNANGIVLTFSDGKDTQPTILNLSTNDLDKRFETLGKDIEQKIFTCHKVTSPMLFGIKSEGQLGGRNELIESFELFNNGYIKSKQKRIEDVFNYLASLNGFEKRLFIIPTQPIGNVLSENVVVPTMTKEEIRVKAGLPAVPKDNVESNNFEKHKFSKDEKDVLDTFKHFGKHKSEVKIIKSDYLNHIHSSNDAKLLEIAFRKKQMFASDDLSNKVLNAIKNNPQLSAKQIASTLSITEKEVNKIISKLYEEGLIEGEIGKDISLTEKGEQQVEISDSTIKVLYSYEVRPELGAEIIDTTRDFCRELIELDKLYTRQEIDSITAITGRDVWRYRGGWYTNPNTDKTTPSCRHQWVQQVVRT